MALLTRITCDTCHQPKDVWHNSDAPAPTTCSDCVGEQKSAAKKKHLDELTRLSADERLKKIEEFIYDFNHTPRPRMPWRG